MVMASEASFKDAPSEQSTQYCPSSASRFPKLPQGSVISFKRTFLEVTASESDQSPRAWSDPGSTTGTERSDNYYDIESLYIGQLQGKLEELWRDKSVASRGTHSPYATPDSSRSSTFDDLSSLLCDYQSPTPVNSSHLVPTSGPQAHVPRLSLGVIAKEHNRLPKTKFASTGSVPKVYKQSDSAALTLKNTFFDVATFESDLSPRAASDPGSTTGTECSENTSELEKSYVKHLQHQWAELSGGSPSCRGQYVPSTFGTDHSASSLSEPIGEGPFPPLVPVNAKAKRISEQKLKQKLSSALAAIEEIPEQVEAVLQTNADVLTTQLQDEVEQVRSMITDARSLNEEKVKRKAVQNMQALPNMVLNSFEASLVLAKNTVQRRVDGVIQDLVATTGDEEIVGQMRLIPATVKEIAGKAMDEATQNFKAQAQQQIEDAIQRLPEACKANLPSQVEVKTQIISIVPDVYPVTLGKVEQAAENAVEQAVAAFQAQRNADELVDDKHADIANQAVADALLRGKVGDSKASPPAGELRILNPGSVGHPELCPRPCLYFVAGQCSNGNSCSFCHLPHHKRSGHLDKRQREIVKHMGVTELVALIRPVLRNKLHGHYLEQKVERLIEEVLEEDGADEKATYGDGRDPSSASSRFGTAAVRKLQASLQHISVRGLIVMLQRSKSSEKNCLDVLVQELRLTEFA